jgi:hypothetical protein
VFHHIPERFVPTVKIRLSLTFDSRVRDGADGYAGFLVEESPYRSGEVEENGLTCQDQSDPLVVAYPLVFLVFFRNLLFVRQIVSIRRPAYLKIEKLV